MKDFLITSSICLLLLLAVYHLFLEKEKMHRFNRFYLLFSILFSFAVPFITIEVVREIPQQAAGIQILNPETMPLFPEEKTNYIPVLLWGLYGAVTLMLGVRFWKNIALIAHRAKSGKAISYKNATLVLLEEKVLPHTFLNTVFINEADYNSRNIETELFAHELTHVAQKHTLDILLVETVKTIFWFNPVFILYKKAIQLNHEFLADEKVVKEFSNVPFYQSLLLSKADIHTGLSLASSLNYSITKKRLLMMTKTTSRTKAALYKIAIAPILSAMVLFLCVETTAQVRPDPLKQPLDKIHSNEVRDTYYSGVRVIAQNKDGTVIVDKEYEELTTPEKDRFLFYAPQKAEKKSPTEQQMEDFKDGKEYAIWIDQKHVANTELNKYKPSDIASFTGSPVFKNARSKKFPQPFQYNFYTHAYFDKYLKDSHKKFSGDTIKIVVSDQEKPAKKHLKKGDVKFKAPNQNDTQPEFPGGMPAFINYFDQNYKVPSSFKGKGRIFISFFVETDGSLSDIKLLREPEKETGAEAIRVLKKSPKWNPGTKDGKPVRTALTLPIQIKEK